MIKVTVLYPNVQKKKFDLQYYLNVHIPLSMNRQGELLKNIQVDLGISGVTEGAKPPYIVMCGFMYHTMEDFFSAFLPHQQELAEDMKKYTDIQPVIQISEVKLMRQVIA